MVYRNTSTTAGSACGNAASDCGQRRGRGHTRTPRPTPIDVLANDTDPDGGAKSVIAVTQTAHGIVKIAGVGRAPTGRGPDYCNSPGGAPDTFTYTLNGGSVGTVAVTVQCAAAPPPPPPPPPRTCSARGPRAYTVGTPGDDVLVGTSARDVLSGRGGDDCLFGLWGDDR